MFLCLLYKWHQRGWGESGEGGVGQRKSWSSVAEFFKVFFFPETYSQGNRYDKCVNGRWGIAPGFAWQGSKLSDVTLQPEAPTRAMDFRKVVESKPFGANLGFVVSKIKKQMRDFLQDLPHLNQISSKWRRRLALVYRVLYISPFFGETGKFTRPYGVLSRRGIWPVPSPSVTPVPTRISLRDLGLTFHGLSQEHLSSNTKKKLSAPFPRCRYFTSNLRRLTFTCYKLPSNGPKSCTWINGGLNATICASCRLQNATTFFQTLYRHDMVNLFCDW